MQKPGGLRINKKESALEAIQRRIPHWIHYTQEDARFVGGKVYLRQCECSICGYVAQKELPMCPNCKTQIRLLKK